MKNMLHFGGIDRVADVRMLYDMAEVIYDREWLKDSENFELYYMYRHLSLNEQDLEIMNSRHLRYDITVIPPAMLGCEFIKTAGHYHPEVPGARVSYAEVYQVLEGEATYLLQKHTGDVIEDVVVVKASKGEVVLIPPGYGHITINASEDVLKMANWVSCEFSSMYDPIREMQGAAYYLLKDGFIENPFYRDHPDIRFLSPVEVPEFGLCHGKDMYELVNDIERLEFLNHPQDFGDVLNGFFDH